MSCDANDASDVSVEGRDEIHHDVNHEEHPSIVQCLAERLEIIRGSEVRVQFEYVSDPVPGESISATVRGKDSRGNLLDSPVERLPIGRFSFQILCTTAIGGISALPRRPAWWTPQRTVNRTMSSRGTHQHRARSPRPVHRSRLTRSRLRPCPCPVCNPACQ